MLNVNVIPASISKFLKDFDLYHPSKERTLAWWEELNSFLATFQFPLPELEEDFYKGSHAKLASYIETIKGESETPLHDLLVIKQPILAMLQDLLRDEVSYWERKELIALRDKLFGELNELTVPEIEAKVNDYLTKPPKGSKDLYEAVLRITPSTDELKRRLADFIKRGATKGDYNLIALACARIEILTNCNDEDLKAKINRSHGNQLFAPDYSNVDKDDYGYKTSLVRLGYIYELEIESLKLRGKTGVPERGPYSTKCFDKPTVDDAKALSENREAFLKSDYPKYLYARCSNSILMYYRKKDIRVTRGAFDYATTKEGLKEHYLPLSDQFRKTVEELKSRVITRRNETRDQFVSTFLNELAVALETTSENFTNATSKRTMRHTKGLLEGLLLTTNCVLAIEDYALRDYIIMMEVPEA